MATVEKPTSRGTRTRCGHSAKRLKAAPVFSTWVMEKKFGMTTTLPKLSATWWRDEDLGEAVEDDHDRRDREIEKAQRGTRHYALRRSRMPVARSPR